MIWSHMACIMALGYLKLVILIVVYCVSVDCQTTVDPLLPTTTFESHSDGNDVENGQELPNSNIHVTSLHINSTIKWRYATSVVKSKVINAGNVSGEAYFTILLPDEAFISNFSIQVENETYYAYVKEKAQAKQEYDEAVSLGQSAGHVAQTSRYSNRFSVSVNVEPEQKMTFVLIYEELLKRKVGLYEHFIDVNPGGVVDQLAIDVYIEETRNITTLKVPEIRNDVEIKEFEKDNELAVININGTSAHVSFSPNKQQQKEINKSGVSGQFVVQYDIDRHVDGGEIQVVNGYFVHFFAPPIQEVIRKHVVFVIDISGSMSGRKMEQTKEAMVSFLKQLQSDDLFNIILFSSDVQSWTVDSIYEKPRWDYDFSEVNNDRPRPKVIPPISVSNASIEAAMNYTNQIDPNGGTNINEALLFALAHSQSLHETVNDAGMVPLIIFLTDGEPTEGVTQPENITANVKQNNFKSEVPIFSLAFGNHADLELLKKISLQNFGFARKVYEASDATLQLEGFYNEISSPLLSKINITYLAEVKTDSLTKTDFKSYFKGSELVVAGKLEDHVNSTKIVSEIEANSKMDEVHLIATCILPPFIIVPEKEKTPDSFYGNFLERMWAFMTIKGLLEQELTLDDAAKKNETKEKALQLSLKYNFVTPLTSMVVVKPNDNKANTSITRTDEKNINQQEIGLTSADISPGPSFGFPGAFGPPPALFAGGFGGAPLNKYSVASYIPSYRPTYFPSTTTRFDLGIQTISTEDYFVHKYDLPELNLDDITWKDKIFNDTFIDHRGMKFDLNVDLNDVLFKTCVSDNGEDVECMHINSCNNTEINQNYDKFIEKMCIFDSLKFTTPYAGVCCPIQLEVDI